MKYIRSVFIRLKNNSVTLILIGLLIILLFTMGVMDKNFLTGSNFSSIASQIPELGILTLAMMITMITGGINLSIVASANLSSILMGLLVIRFAEDSVVPMPFAIAITIVVGLGVSAIIGLINGLVIVKLRVTPMVATLSTQLLIDGVSIAITKGYVVNGIPQEFMQIAATQVFKIPLVFIVFIACSLAVALMLYKTPMGKSLYMYGSNNVATAFSGVNCNRLIIDNYILSNVLAGVTAVIMLARFNSASVGYSTSYLLQTVLICVLGGLNPNGGNGRVFDVLLAVIVLRLVSNGFNLLSISSYLTTAIWGLLLLAVLAIRTNDGKTRKGSVLIKTSSIKGGKKE